jgi:hypothetical protein
MEFEDSEEEVVDGEEEVEEEAESSSAEEEESEHNEESNDDYPIIKVILPPNQRRTSKDYLDQMETAQLIATFAQMISDHNYMPPINTDGHDDPRDIAIKAIMERGLDRKKKTIPFIIERVLPQVIDKNRGKIIQYVEKIDPNDTSIAIPFLPALKELSKAI